MENSEKINKETLKALGLAKDALEKITVAAKSGTPYTYEELSDQFTDHFYALNEAIHNAEEIGNEKAQE